MNNSLRELTNTIDTLKTEHKEHTVKLPCSHELDTNRIQDLLAVSVSEIDFGECTPRNVLTQKLSIMLKKPLPFARIIGIKIICKDKTINDLP